MLRFFRKLRKDENGATAIEYGLIAGLISVVIIAAVSLVGTTLSALFTYIAGESGLSKALP
jgi:pilus assembly protein Flp/PilA